MRRILCCVISLHAFIFYFDPSIVSYCNEQCLCCVFVPTFLLGEGVPQKKHPLIVVGCAVRPLVIMFRRDERFESEYFLLAVIDVLRY